MADLSAGFRDQRQLLWRHFGPGGKAHRDLFGKVLGLAGRFGGEDDVRVLTFMVTSRVKDSDRFNPFTIRQCGYDPRIAGEPVGDQGQNDPNGVFRERAVALVGTIAPVLVWLRNHEGITLNIEFIRSSIDLSWIWKVAIEKKVLLRDPDNGQTREIDVSGEIPEEVTWSLRAYLGELPGYDPTVPLDKQKGNEPSKRRGFARLYFNATFTRLAVSLGHIFRAENGEIEMRGLKCRS